MVLRDGTGFDNQSELDPPAAVRASASPSGWGASPWRVTLACGAAQDPLGEVTIRSSADSTWVDEGYPPYPLPDLHLLDLVDAAEEVGS